MLEKGCVLTDNTAASTHEANEPSFADHCLNKREDDYTLVPRPFPERSREETAHDRV